MSKEALRIVRVSELPGGAERVRTWILEEWGNTHQEEDQEIRDHILGKASNLEARVAVLGGVPVGAVAFKRHELLDEAADVLWINALYVVPQHRRTGIGTKLVANAESAAARKEEKIYAFTGIPEFYEAHGWNRHSEDKKWRNWIVFKCLNF